ncbi:unnamed protein product [Sphagnum tenellum]
MATDDTDTEFGFCCLRLRGCWLKKGIAAIETSRKLPLRTTGLKPTGDDQELRECASEVLVSQDRKEH